MARESCGAAAIRNSCPSSLPSNFAGELQTSGRQGATNGRPDLLLLLFQWPMKPFERSIAVAVAVAVSVGVAIAADAAFVVGKLETRSSSLETRAPPRAVANCASR